MTAMMPSSELLIAADLSGAVETAERVRRAIAGLVIGSPPVDFGITVSIGVTTLARSDADWSEALRRADEGLYQAKAAGRNKVVAIPPEDVVRS
jgi:diguanylate cyclase (GGDEF)-like protein